MTLYCNIEGEEYERIFKAFPDQLSGEEEQILSTKFTQYVFYETWGRRDFRECICTSCGGFEMYKDEDATGFFHHKHGDEIECPHCGETVKLYALGRMRTGASLEETQRAAIIKVAPDGGVYIDAGYARKEYSFNDLRPVVDWTSKVQTYLAPGRRAQRKRTIGSWGFYACWGAGGWENCKTVQEPFVPYMYTSDGSYWLIFPERLADTQLKYNQLEDWYFEETHNDIMDMDTTIRQAFRYLAAYTEFPQMEMAEKIGMHNAVNDLVFGRKNHRYLNWSATNIPDFLRMDKASAKLFLQAEGDLGALKIYREAYKKCGTGMREYMTYVNKLSGSENVVKAAGCAAEIKVPLPEAVRYIYKQLPECPRAGISPGRIIQIWKDYLDMARTLEYDLTEMTVAMPKNLQERHDNAAKIIAIRKHNESKKKMATRTKQLKKLYEFSYGGMVIVVPESDEEIIREGKTLHHCVGGYANRHVEGKLDILFLRKERKPGTSFITIEMDPRKVPTDKVHIRQIHGYSNERYKGGYANNPSVKYDWFLQVWKEWMRKGSKRDKNGRPILPKRKDNAV